jgi:hypothetical protein
MGKKQEKKELRDRYHREFKTGGKNRKDKPKAKHRKTK